MFDNFIEKLKGFLLNPVETFQKSREDTLGATFTYYIILVIISAILSALVAWGFASLSPFASIPGLGGFFPATVFIMVIIGGIIGPFIGGAWLHIFVWLLGGRKGYVQTVKAVMYGSTPGLLLSWIPIIGFIGGIWSIILEILGIRELQEISTGRAIAAVILAVVIILIIVALIAAALLIAVISTTTGTPVPY
jgi:hypothetical protein